MDNSKNMEPGIRNATVQESPNKEQRKKESREHLGRGVIAIRENPSTVVVSWRYLSSDPMDGKDSG